MKAPLVTAAAALLALPLAAPATATAASSKFDLYLDFNDSSSDNPDLTSSGSAPVTAEVVAAEGGKVRAESKGKGKAIRMEPFDPDTPAELGVVVAWPEGSQDAFAPRSASFSFGATFNLDSRSEGTKVDNGNNLVQRGLYDDDAQYKIQVDDNRVSCRISGSAGAVEVRANVAVRTRAWHRVRCLRQGSSVKLVLVELTSDGPVKRKWTRNGATGDLAFSAEPPLSVGGKVNSSGALVKASADQFNGRVDNVFFRHLDG